MSFFIRKIADRNVFFVVKIAFLSAFSFLLHLPTGVLSDFLGFLAASGEPIGC